MFSKALLTATYKNGRPGQPTEAHEKAEHHRFKKEYLFKNTAIPKDVYASRLIQHFLILKAIETQLQSLSGTAKSEISAFFALSYLEQLWRTPGIEQDLRQLGINPDTIHQNEVANTTKKYLEDLKKLPPKALLAHFLLHVAGFMHGGNIIQNKYIEPSNKLTSYQIPTQQYDFSSAASFLSQDKPSGMALYNDMMKQVDNITLDEAEYEEIHEQCKGIYESMSSLYDDLCEMHVHHPIRDMQAATRQPKGVGYSLAILGVSLVVLAVVLKLMTDFLSPMINRTSPSPC